MSRTTNLRRQHDAAILLAAEIRSLADGQRPLDQRAGEIATLLAKLTGLLRIHFAQEDKTLYPWLIAAPDGPTAATAAAFQSEMGQLGGTYADFSERWLSRARLTADMAGFRAEADAVFAALARRIRRENEDLYPLADRLAAEQARPPLPANPDIAARAA